MPVGHMAMVHDASPGEVSTPLPGSWAPLPDAPAREELVSGLCGYGVHRTLPPHRCPMCHGSAWRRSRSADRTPAP